MRVLVTGGRQYPNWQLVCRFLDSLHARYGLTAVIQGGAPGTDTHALNWAMRNKVPAITEPVTKEEWDRIGRSAGIKRNERMLDKHQPHLVVGFPGDNGTRYMLNYGVEKQVPTMIVPDPAYQRALLEFDFGPDINADLTEEDMSIEPKWLWKPGPRDKWARRREPAEQHDYTAEALF